MTRNPNLLLLIVALVVVSFAGWATVAALVEATGGVPVWNAVSLADVARVR